MEHLAIMSDDLLQQALIAPLDKAIDALSQDALLDERLESNRWFEPEMMVRVVRNAAHAFSDHDEEALRQAHAALFTLYELHTCDPVESRAVNQHNALLGRVRKTLETAWLQSERPNVPAVDAPGAVPAQVSAMWSAHAASAHPLFDFLERDATRAQMEHFFLSDSALNIRFFDLIALALVGSREASRAELVQNLWDESGNGERAQAHVRMFRDLLDVCGITQARAAQALALRLPGLAGHNLFMMSAINRQHYFKSLGVMAITELMDPSQYEKVVRGCRRLGFGDDQFRYYAEHITIDVVHGQGWLNNVIAPAVERSPEAGADILFGAYLRLSTCQHYYDDLLAQLYAKAA